MFVVLLVNGMVNDTARFLLYSQGQVGEQHGCWIMKKNTTICMDGHACERIADILEGKEYQAWE